MSSDTAVDGPRPRLAPWLVAPMWANRALYAKVVLAAVMINLFGLASSIFAMTVYDRVLPNNAVASLVGLSIGMAIVVIFDFVLKTLRAYFVDVAGANIDRTVGQRIFDQLVNMRLGLRKGSTGQLTGLMRELESLRDFFTSATLTAVVDVPFILLTLIVIGALGGRVVWVPVLLIPLVILTGIFTHPALERLSSRALTQGMAKQSVLIETIGGIEMVKTSGAAPLLARRWIKAIDSHADSSLRQRLVAAIGMNVATSANTICYAGIVIVGVEMIANHMLTMGALVACSMLSSRAIAPLAQVASLLTRMTATRTAYRQLDQMMRQPPEGPAADGLRPARIEGRIGFRNVSFTYPGAAEPALREVSLAIAPGERVALIGKVGSGKSTIARLLLGLHEPAAGLIQIDGSDLRQIHPAAIRRHIGAALQDSVLISGTIRENIMLERAGIDDAEMLRAATVSGTQDFVGTIANGYDLRLADRGESLSGGQRQSIALARALAGRPPILLFDEPTSAMDPGSEAQLLQRLSQELEGRTLILITHRPALLALANRIVVVEDGRIVRDGPRDEVLKPQAPSGTPPPGQTPQGTPPPGAPSGAAAAPARPSPPRAGSAVMPSFKPPTMPVRR